MQLESTLGKLLGAFHVRALTHVEERPVGIERERLVAALLDQFSGVLEFVRLLHLLDAGQRIRRREILAHELLVGGR